MQLFFVVVFIVINVVFVVVVVVVVASVGHPVVAPQRCSVAMWLNSFLVVVFVVLYFIIQMIHFCASKEVFEYCTTHVY